MGILSNSTSIMRYRVEGQLPKPVTEHVYQKLEADRFREIGDRPDEVSEDVSIGWTSFDRPYLPDFEGSSFVVDTDFVFSLRVDKKSVPPKVIRKHLALAMEKNLKKSGRDYLTKNEKKELMEHIEKTLLSRVPSVPNIFDIIWRHEENLLFFHTLQKGANEILETLFKKSFGFSLIRLFPFTLADLHLGLSGKQKDSLATISQTRFVA